MALQVHSCLSALLLPFKAVQEPVNVRDRDTRAVTKYRGQFSFTAVTVLTQGSAAFAGALCTETWKSLLGKPSACRNCLKEWSFNH